MYVHHDKELIAAADAYLASPDWIRVEDALPEILDGATTVQLWVTDGKSVWANEYQAWHPGVSRNIKVTHWRYRYAEPTPQPPEGSK